MLRNAVVSSCLGRIRLRHKAFKGIDLSSQITALENIEGITKVEYNKSSASLLVLYKAKIVAEKTIHQELDKLFTPLLKDYKEPENTSNSIDIVQPLQNIVQKAALQYGKKKTSDFMVNAMATTLIPSVVFSFTGAKRLHIILGGAFLVFAAGHTLMYRKNNTNSKA